MYKINFTSALKKKIFRIEKNTKALNKKCQKIRQETILGPSKASETADESNWRYAKKNQEKIRILAPGLKIQHSSLFS